MENIDKYLNKCKILEKMCGRGDADEKILDFLKENKDIEKFIRQTRMLSLNAAL